MYFITLTKLSNFLHSKLNLSYYITFGNDFLKYILKKYIYTINHKRIAINYLIFCLWSGLAGTILATMIRIELAMPGSFLFKHDSIRYLQVITAHGLTMIFFVVVPLVFGAVANFFIPYHIGSKDVAFPRLNSLGFWLLPSGYVLLAKPAFLRSPFLRQYDNSSYFFKLFQKPEFMNNHTNNFYNVGGVNAVEGESAKNFLKFSFKNIISTNIAQTSDTFWRVAINNIGVRQKKKYTSKCSNAIATKSGWTFITPFS